MLQVSTLSAREAECKNPSCGRCPIVKQSVFSNLKPEELATLNVQNVSRTFAKGETIIDFDQEPSGVFCVLSGVVKITRPLSSGEKVLVQLGSRGDTLGSKALLRGTTNRIAAHAATPVEACFLPASYFMQTLKDQSKVSFTLMSKLCGVIETAEENLARMASLNVKGRVAQVLSDLAKRFGRETPSGVQLEVPLSRQELAQLAGTVVESVVRQLGEFKKEGLIEVTGRHIMILKPTELAAIT